VWNKVRISDFLNFYFFLFPVASSYVLFHGLLIANNLGGVNCGTCTTPPLVHKSGTQTIFLVPTMFAALIQQKNKVSIWIKTSQTINPTASNCSVA